MEKPSLGINHKLLLFPSLVEQEQAVLLHTLLWDVLGWFCSGSWQLGRAEMCLDNLVVLGVRQS